MQTLADNALFEAYSATQTRGLHGRMWIRAASDLGPESGSGVEVGGRGASEREWLSGRSDSVLSWMRPIGGALAAECPISMLTDEDDGLTVRVRGATR